MKNKKGIKKVNYNYSEEFITTIKFFTDADLKNLFNKKYFKLISRREKMNFGDCNYCE